MASRTPNLPEGTDSIIAGASVIDADERLTSTFDPAGGGDSGGVGGETVAATATTLRDQAVNKAADLRGQATDKAREFALQGKDRATEALDNVAKLIGDTAAQVDEKVGAQYGDYARRASDTVANLATTLRDRDVDQLFADARDLVRRSPGMAIGAAAVVGFALVRLVKAGIDAPATGNNNSTANSPADKSAD